MHHMIFDCLRIYQDVIQDDNDEVVQVIRNYVINWEGVAVHSSPFHELL